MNITPVFKVGNLGYTLITCAGNSSVKIQGSATRKKELISLWLRLVCDATVANRNIRITPQTSGGVPVDQIVTGSNIVGSGTGYLIVSRFSDKAAGVTFGYADWVLAPFGLWVGGSAAVEIKCDINNGVAGDVLTGYYAAFETPN